jgi:hypothetical protein
MRILVITTPTTPHVKKHPEPTKASTFLRYIVPKGLAEPVQNC